MSEPDSGTPELIPLINWALFLAGGVNLLFGTWYMIQLKTDSAGIALTAGLILLLAASIERFESLKGLGVEAKTRQLNQKINEADELLKKLRDIAELSCSGLIVQNSKIGRWGAAPTAREAYSLAEQVRSTLKALGTSDDRQKEILKPWVSLSIVDLKMRYYDKNQATINEIIAKRAKLTSSFGTIENENREQYDAAVDNYKKAEKLKDAFLNSINEEQSLDSLRTFFREFPDLPAELRAATLAEIDTWDSEIISLKQSGDFLDKNKWFSFLDRSCG